MISESKNVSVKMIKKGDEKLISCKHDELICSSYTVDGGILVWICPKCHSWFQTSVPVKKLKRIK